MKLLHQFQPDFHFEWSGHVKENDFDIFGRYTDPPQIVWLSCQARDFCTNISNFEVNHHTTLKQLLQQPIVDCLQWQHLKSKLYNSENKEIISVRFNSCVPTLQYNEARKNKSWPMKHYSKQLMFVKFFSGRLPSKIFYSPCQK